MLQIAISNATNCNIRYYPNSNAKTRGGNINVKNTNTCFKGFYIHLCGLIYIDASMDKNKHIHI